MTIEEITIKAARLTNITYSRLADLIDNELGKTDLELDSVEEAEMLIHIQKCIAQKVSCVLLRIDYEEETT